MLFSKSSKVIGTLTMSMFLSHFPSVVFASAGMIPTHKIVSEMSQTKELSEVRDFLNRSDVKKILEARGLSSEEAERRVSSLSQMELKQLSTQIQQARAGGDILTAILLVILIIFFAQRI